MKIVDYEDLRGVMRRVKLPDDENDVSVGIPIDIYDILEVTLYSNAPEGFKINLFNALWKRGLVESIDLNKRNAHDLFMSALRSALKLETHSAIKSIQEFLNHD